MQAVAERAGMSRGAIYGDFRDREDLIYAVVATLGQRGPAAAAGALHFASC